MQDILDSIKNSIESAASSIHDHFKSLVSDVETFINNNGGISGILSMIESKIHIALNIITQLAAVFHIPVSDISLLTKAYAGVQQLDSIVKTIQGAQSAS